MKNVSRVTLFSSIKDVLKYYGIDYSKVKDIDTYIDLIEDLCCVAGEFGATSSIKTEVDNQVMNLDLVKILLVLFCAQGSFKGFIYIFGGFENEQFKRF